MPQKEENEGGLVGALKLIKDKDIALQSLVVDNEATMQLAKQREDHTKNLKMKLSLMESRTNELMMAEAKLMKDKEELLKEIEVLCTEVDRNQEGTESAIENLRFDEEIRRLKSFFEEGEREKMTEQITTLQNKMLEALDRKSKHEAGTPNASVVEETPNTPGNQPVEDHQTSKFTWRIKNFSQLKAKGQHCSEIFSDGGYKWRILIYPEGNNVEYLSMFLDVADSASLPYGWSTYAEFKLGLINEVHSKYDVKQGARHRFSAGESNWGFTKFLRLRKLHDPSRGFLVNDTLVVEAEFMVHLA